MLTPQLLKRSISWNTAQVFSSIGLQLLQFLYVTHSTPEADWGGIAAVCLIVASLKGFKDLGLPMSLVNKEKLDKGNIGPIFLLSGFSSVLIGIGLILFATPLVEFFGAEGRAWELQLCSIIFFSSALGQVFPSLMHREIRFKRFSAIEIFSHVVSCIVTFTFYSRSNDPNAFIFGMVAGSITRQIGYFAALPRFHRYLFKFRVGPSLGEHIHFGAYQLLTMLLATIYNKADQFLVAAALSTSQHGIYNLALQLTVELFARIAPIVTNVAYPVFSKLRVHSDAHKQAFLNLHGAVIYTAMPACAGLSLISPSLVDLLWPGKEAVAAIIPITALAAFFRPLLSTAYIVTLAWNRPKHVTYATGILSFIQIALLSLNASYFPTVEAISWTICTSFALVWLGYVFYYFPKYFSVKAKATLGLLPAPIIYCLTMAAALHILDVLWQNPNPLPTILVKIPLGVVVYGMLVYLFSREQFNAMKSIIMAKKDN